MIGSYAAGMPIGMNLSMRVVPEYVAECIVIPARIDKVPTFIGEYTADVRARRYRRCLLLSSVGTRASLLGGTLKTGSLSEAGEPLVATHAAVLRQIRSLIAPEGADTARAMIIDALELPDLDDLANDILSLPQSLDLLKRALLGLEIGPAINLLNHYHSNSDLADDLRKAEDNVGLDRLIDEFARIRGAWVLQVIASDCAHQLASPTGDFMLDQLDGGSCARLGSLYKLLSTEIARFDQINAFYNRPSTVAEAEVRSAVPLTIINRATELLTVWRNNHGDELESLVAHMLSLGGETAAACAAGVAGRRRQLQKRAGGLIGNGHANTLIANCGKLHAGIRLALAIRTIVAWLASASSKDHAAATSDHAISAIAARGSHLEEIMHQRRQPASRRKRLPRVAFNRRLASRSMELFVIYRILFLNDRDVLPAQIRQIARDKAAGTTIVTRRDAEYAIDRILSFDEIHDAHVEQVGSGTENNEIRRGVDKLMKIVAAATGTKKDRSRLAIAVAEAEDLMRAGITGTCAISTLIRGAGTPN